MGAEQRMLTSHPCGQRTLSRLDTVTHPRIITPTDDAGPQTQGPTLHTVY